MPFHIVRNDITKMEVDAIVNTANPKPVIGSGVDSGIHQKAGQGLLAARKLIGDIAIGDAAITGAFDLPAKYVIHTSGPVWQGGALGEVDALTSCYSKSLQLALKHGCESVAFPLISSGNYGFPKGVALQTAVSAISSFLMKHEMNIYMVVFDKEAFTLSENMIADVKCYIDEHYVEEVHALEYRDDAAYGDRRFGRRMQEAVCAPSFVMEEAMQAAVPAAGKRSLEDLLKEVDDSFSTHLLRLIDDRGLKDSDVYKKANVDRKLFHKIKNNPEYKPSKMTAIAFAIALELSLDETRDLLGRAGYALTHSSVFDIVVEYFIKNGIYDTFEMNAVLFKLDQPTIGC